MIVADTSALIALADADSAQHDALLTWYDADPDQWVIPWAVLPEVDYMLGTHVSERAQLAFIQDVADAAYVVEWGTHADIVRARVLCEQYSGLRLGLVDAVVMAIAERLQADAIATLDYRHFGAVKLQSNPLLLPRDG